MATKNNSHQLHLGKRLLAYFKPFWPKLILVGLLLLLGIGFNLLEPYFLGKIIDEKLLVGDWEGARKMIFLLLGIYGGAWLTRLLQTRLMAKIPRKPCFFCGRIFLFACRGFRSAFLTKGLMAI